MKKHSTQKKDISFINGLIYRKGWLPALLGIFVAL